MKQKRYLFGTVLTAAVLCAALAFNSFAFPALLAKPPQDSAVKTMANTQPLKSVAEDESAVSTRKLSVQEEIAQAEEKLKKAEATLEKSLQKELDALEIEKAKAELAQAQAKLNRLSEDEAVAIAKKELAREEYPADAAALPYQTRLVEALAPLQDARWCVTFCREEADRKTFYAITIDALTGEIYGRVNGSSFFSAEDRTGVTEWYVQRIGGEYAVTETDCENTRFIVEVYGGDCLLIAFFEESGVVMQMDSNGEAVAYTYHLDLMEKLNSLYGGNDALQGERLYVLQIQPAKQQ